MDSSISYNSTPILLVQALHLPVSIIQPVEIMLPNGKKVWLMILVGVYIL